VSDEDERYQQLRANYKQAAKNEDDDVRAAKAEGDFALARQISKNVQKARIALADGLAAGFAGHSGAIEAAFDDLKAANSSVVAAREAAQGIADLFNLLSGATDSAKRLAEALAERGDA
jgi:hypothetical protein